MVADTTVGRCIAARSIVPAGMPYSEIINQAVKQENHISNLINDLLPAC